MRIFAGAALVVAVLSQTGGAAETTFAVAANFSEPMQAIVAAFARDTGHRALLAVGSTGKLETQIRQGAPFDAFLSADQRTPELLANDAWADPASRFTYAIGRLALWSAQERLVDKRGAILATGDFQKLALADPKLAPYGAAALEVLVALRLEERLRPRLVYGESIGQSYLFVASGNAPLGFVALSQVQKDGVLKSGSVWIVPQRLYHPLKQDFVLLTHGASNPAAQALARYLRGVSARRIMRSYGYD
jgi:molybdate transport system substrate-binding protein